MKLVIKSENLYHLCPVQSVIEHFETGNAIVRNVKKYWIKDENRMMVKPTDWFILKADLIDEIQDEFEVNRYLTLNVTDFAYGHTIHEDAPDDDDDDCGSRLSLIINSHLSDAIECAASDPVGMKKRIGFVKYLITVWNDVNVQVTDAQIRSEWTRYHIKYWKNEKA